MSNVHENDDEIEKLIQELNVLNENANNIIDNHYNHHNNDNHNNNDYHNDHRDTPSLKDMLLEMSNITVPPPTYSDVCDEINDDIDTSDFNKVIANLSSINSDNITFSKNPMSSAIIPVNDAPIDNVNNANNETKLDIPNYGISGLRNIGNTCYMNSVLQALASIPSFLGYLVSDNSMVKEHIMLSLLSDYFDQCEEDYETYKLDESYIKVDGVKIEYTSDNGVYIKYEPSHVHEVLYRTVTYQLRTLYKRIMFDNVVVRPTKLKQSISNHIPYFAGYDQHDAHEFIYYLMERIHDETAGLISQTFYDEFISVLNIEKYTEVLHILDTYDELSEKMSKISSEIYNLNKKINEIKQNEENKRRNTVAPSYLAQHGISVGNRNNNASSSRRTYNFGSTNHPIGHPHHRINNQFNNQIRPAAIEVYPTTTIAPEYQTTTIPPTTTVTPEVEQENPEIVRLNNRIGEYNIESMAVHEDIKKVIKKMNEYLQEIPYFYVYVMYLRDSYKAFDSEYSYINSIFTGFLITMTQCSECKNIFNRFEKFESLTLNIPDEQYNPDKSYSVNDLLKNFFKTENMRGNDQYVCYYCGKKCNAIKVTKFYKIPSNLVVLIKKYQVIPNTDEYDQRVRGKLMKTSTPVKLEETINLEELSCVSSYNIHHDNNKEFEPNYDKPDMNYKLISTVKHYGSLGSGHYTSFKMHPITGQWTYHDDESVFLSNIDDVMNSNSYVGIYTNELN